MNNMKAYQIAGYLVEDTVIFTKKVVKKSTKFSLKLLTGISLFTALMLSGDYLINHKMYNEHYSLKHSYMIGSVSPFVALPKKHVEFLAGKQSGTSPESIIFKKEWKESKQYSLEQQVKLNIESLKKMLTSMKGNENNITNPYMVTFRDFELSMAVIALHRNPLFDNNEEFIQLKKEIIEYGTKHYLDFKSIDKSSSDYITDFCNTGIIGRVSCYEQSMNTILAIMGKDTLNNQEFFDVEGTKNNYKGFMRLMNKTPEDIRKDYEKNKAKDKS